MLAMPIVNAGLLACSRKSRRAGSTKRGSATAPTWSCPPACCHQLNEQPGQFIPVRSMMHNRDKFQIAQERRSQGRFLVHTPGGFELLHRNPRARSVSPWVALQYMFDSKVENHGPPCPTMVTPS